MADDVAYTPGTGTNVATDEIGSAHYQRMKMGLGGDGFYREVQPVTVIASGALSVAATLASSSGVLFGVWAGSTSAGQAKVLLYDSTSGSSGKVLWAVDFRDDRIRSDNVWFGPQGLKVNSGLRAEVSPGDIRMAVYYISPA